VRFAFGLVLGAVALSGCGEKQLSTGPEDHGPPGQPTVHERVVSDANTAFGLRLLREVLAEESEPNVLLSPLSASMALGMTMNGANADTYAAMRDALGF